MQTSGAGRVKAVRLPVTAFGPHWFPSPEAAVSGFLTFAQHRGLPVTSQATGSVPLPSPLWPPVTSEMGWAIFRIPTETRAGTVSTAPAPARPLLPTGFGSRPRVGAAGFFCKDPDGKSFRLRGRVVFWTASGTRLLSPAVGARGSGGQRPKAERRVWPLDSTDGL